jgi:hypothetical protein
MNKHCQQQLDKFGMKVEDVTHVCVASNLYPFIQYYLLMDDDTVFHHTYYFFNDVIPEKIQQNFPCSVYKYINKSIKDKVLKRTHKLQLRYFKYSQFPFLKSAEIYAYDIPYLSLCIGNRPYNLLADAPHYLTLLTQENSQEHIRNEKRAQSLSGKIKGLFFGDIYIHFHGSNSQCKRILLTEENTSPVLKGKEVLINPLDILYESSSKEKKDFLKNILNISDYDIELLKSRPNLFFSQPMTKDCGLTDAEYVEVLKHIFQNYPTHTIMVKAHPRDTFDYKAYFPDVELFSKPINSQILSILGLCPQRIFTICSTAIEGFPESSECDYYGAHVHPKIERFFGNNYKPFRKVNMILG